MVSVGASTTRAANWQFAPSSRPLTVQLRYVEALEKHGQHGGVGMPEGHA